MFCFETALKMWYFSCLMYTVSEVREASVPRSGHPLPLPLPLRLLSDASYLAECLPLLYVQVCVTSKEGHLAGHTSLSAGVSKWYE
jgi:hypothetical protein